MRKPYRLTAPVVPEHPLQRQIADVLRLEIAPPGKVSQYGVCWFSIDHANFAGEVETFKFLPAANAALLARTLPFIELALGLLLLIGWRVRYWLTGVSLLLVVFLSVLTRAYLLHLDIKDCGCFATPEPLNGMTLVRDSVFLAAALLCTYFAFVEARKPHPWTAPS